MLGGALIAHLEDDLYSPRAGAAALLGVLGVLLVIRAAVLAVSVLTDPRKL